MAIVDQFVSLEQQVGLISQQFSGYVFVLVGVQDVALAHDGQYGLDQVLEPLFYECISAILEFA